VPRWVAEPWLRAKARFGQRHRWRRGISWPLKAPPWQQQHQRYCGAQRPRAECITWSNGWSQKDARNIKQGFAPGHKNIHFLKEALYHYQQQLCSPDTKALSETKSAFEADCETKWVALTAGCRIERSSYEKNLLPEEEMELFALPRQK
jgi:hypothetical protein